MKLVLTALAVCLLAAPAFAQELEPPSTEPRKAAAKAPTDKNPELPKEESKAEEPAAQTGIKWLHDFAEAKTQASKENKKLLLCFSTSWCGPCKALQKTVWSSEDVATRVAKDFVPCKIDGDADKDTCKIYDIRGYPTIILAQADGTVIVKEVGAKALGRTADSAIMWIDDQLKTPGRLAALEKARADNPTDPMAAKKLADAYFAAGRKADAAKLYDIAEKLLDDALIDVKLKQCDALVVSKEAAKATAIMDELLPRLLKAKDERVVDSTCTFANLLARFAEKKDPKKARQLMLYLMAAFPEHKRIKEFRCWAMMYAHMDGDNETAKKEAQKLVDEGPANDPYVDRCSRFIKQIDSGHKYK